jgi:TfoX/Sxy family transcriptional regulator of competence genes
MKQNKYHQISYRIYFHDKIIKVISVNTIYFRFG